MDQFKLRLFVKGSDKITEAVVAAVKNLCNNMVGDSAELEIVDVLENREVALKENVRNTPMLIKEFPFPKRRISGDFLDNAMLLSNLHSEPTQH